jgi:hypothetical protein
MLPGPGAIVAGPTFAEWLETVTFRAARAVVADWPA